MPKLCKNGQKLAENKINLRWPGMSEGDQNKALSRAATEEMLSDYLRQDLNSLKMENLLDSGLIIPESENYLRKTFPRVVAGRDTLEVTQLKSLIDKGEIVAKGFSKDTCRRFRKGENIPNQDTFDFLFDILEIRFDELETANYDTIKERKLRTALGQFNHSQQCATFYNYAANNSYCLPFIVRSSVVNIPNINLLLNCLLHNLDDEPSYKSHLILDLGSYMATKKRLDQQLIKALKDKGIQGLKNDLDPQQILDIIIDNLSKQHIMIAIPYQGVKTTKDIITSFWNPLYNRIRNYENLCGLLLCFYPHHGTGQDNNNIDGITVLETLSRFTEDDLRNWLNTPKIIRLMRGLQAQDLQPDKLWQESQGDVDRLITTLYQKFVDSETQGVPDSWKKIG